MVFYYNLLLKVVVNARGLLLQAMAQVGGLVTLQPEVGDCRDNWL